MVVRDVAFVAKADLSNEAVEKCVRKAGPKELVGVRIFDVFSSKELGKDKRSYAYSLAFRSPERTLTDDEVNGAFAKIAEALKTQLGVELREG